MASKNLNDRKAECPFFRNHTAQTLTCEGIIDGTTDQLSFAPRRSKKLHFELYCCYKYPDCPRYKRLMEKYQEE